MSSAESPSITDQIVELEARAWYADQALEQLNATDNPADMYRLLARVADQTEIPLTLSETAEHAAQRMIDVLRGRIADSTKRILELSTVQAIEICDEIEPKLSARPVPIDPHKGYMHFHIQMGADYERLKKAAALLQKVRNTPIILKELSSGHEKKSDYKDTYEGDLQIMKDAVATIRAAAGPADMAA